jgi:carbonic anhydrase
LLAGNRRFVRGEPRYGHHVSAAVAAAGDQHPIAVVLGCVDSRVPPEAVLDQSFGALSVVRSGGQVLDRAVLGSIEFAVTDLGAPLVMVLGHTRCGAVQATIEALRTGTRPDGQVAFLADQLTPAVQAAGVDPVASAATRVHVAQVVARLQGLRRLRGEVGSGRVQVVGAVYDLDSGRVELLG